MPDGPRADSLVIQGTRGLPEALRTPRRAHPPPLSLAAYRLRNFAIYRFATGPAGQQIGTDEYSVPRRLPAPPFEVGIIAGKRSNNMFFGRVLGGESDGKVTVESARLDGMRDIAIVDRGHTFLMWAPDVLQHVFTFLDTGSFRSPA